jgi:putative colanic acid biosynthesis UDP-glucose lipid carrier transferase
MSTPLRGILHAHQSTLSVAHRLLDLAVITLGGYCVNLLTGSAMGTESWMQILLAAVAFHWLAEYHQLYGSWRGERIVRELLKVANYWGLAFVLLSFVDYLLLQPADLADNSQMAWFAVVLVALCGYRLAIRSLLHTLRSRGFNTRRVAIVGTGHCGERLALSIERAPWMGLNLLGFYDEQPEQMDLARIGRRIPVLGDLDN